MAEGFAKKHGIALSYEAPERVTADLARAYSSFLCRLTLAFSGRGKMVERHGVHDPDADADRVR